jgi:mannose-6-phosphate isomerase-like protein (cupin superfamily)
MEIKEERPWGWFTTISKGHDYKVKEIFVNPGSRFSLQYHNHREEHWTIVEGSGIITIGDEEQQVKPGDHFYIPVKGIHRLMGHDNGVLFIEVQRGICLPDDIIRLEDDYGRD